MFPGAGAEVYYNEAGEVMGWDYPSDDPMDYYCDMCGFSHAGECQWDGESDDYDDPDDDDEDDWMEWEMRDTLMVPIEPKPNTDDEYEDDLERTDWPYGPLG